VHAYNIPWMFIEVMHYVSVYQAVTSGKSILPRQELMDFYQQTRAFQNESFDFSAAPAISHLLFNANSFKDKEIRLKVLVQEDIFFSLVQWLRFAKDGVVIFPLPKSFDGCEHLYAHGLQYRRLRAVPLEHDIMHIATSKIAEAIFESVASCSFTKKVPNSFGPNVSAVFLYVQMSTLMSKFFIRQNMLQHIFMSIMKYRSLPLWCNLRGAFQRKMNFFGSF